MLPILRILPVGGVLLAIFILVLALSPPDGSRTPLNSAIVPARGALLDRDRHPEVRQLLIYAALKRADELNRLRDLPDSPMPTTKAPPRVAGLPSDRNESDPDDTGSIKETPGVSIPVEIGEPSSAELPVTAPEDKASAAGNPESKAQREARRRVHRVRAAKATTKNAQQFNFFEMLFGGQPYQRPAYGPQRYPQPAYGTQQPGRYPQPAYGTQQPGRYPQPAYNYGAPQYQLQPYASDESNQQSAFSQVPRTNPY